MSWLQNAHHFVQIVFSIQLMSKAAAICDCCTQIDARLAGGC